MKTTISVIIGVLLVIGAIVIIGRGNDGLVEDVNINTQIQATSTNITNNTTNTGTTTNTTSTSVKATTTSTSSGSGDSRSKTYTMADVATHNSTQSCWSAVNGKVYDLTSWIAKHPGGKEAILSICGKDGSAAFSKQHGDDEKPQYVITSYQIGILTQ